MEVVGKDAVKFTLIAKTALCFKPKLSMAEKLMNATMSVKAQMNARECKRKREAMAMAARPKPWRTYTGR